MEIPAYKTVAMIDGSIIRKFAASLNGKLILSDDTSYETARRIWNQTVERHPGMIVRCADAEDVVRAVGFARSNDLQIAIRGGGHSFAGHSVCNDGLVVDFAAMKDIQVDSVRHVACAQGGVKVGEFDRATQAFGLATVMGGCEDVGIAGLTLGGGQGSLTGRYGLACDNVISIDVVTADGRLLTASAQENADLFWGMKGGAGNFGIATTFCYRLHSVSRILGGAVAYPVEQAKQVLHFWRDYLSDQPDELTTLFAAFRLPEGPGVGIAACYCGDLEQGEKVLRPLGAFGSPLMNSLGPMSYLDFQHSIEPFNPSGVSAYRKSNFFNQLTDESIEVIANFLLSAPDSFFVGTFPYRGAVCRVAVSETAFPIREYGYDIWIDSFWRQPSEAAASVDWVNNFWHAMRPFTTGAVYVNNLGDEGGERIKAAYGANYDRLVALKNKYDPTNFFHLNQNIKPAAYPKG